MNGRKVFRLSPEAAAVIEEYARRHSITLQGAADAVVQNGAAAIEDAEDARVLRAEVSALQARDRAWQKATGCQDPSAGAVRAVESNRPNAGRRR